MEVTTFRQIQVLVHLYICILNVQAIQNSIHIPNQTDARRVTLLSALRTREQQDGFSNIFLRNANTLSSLTTSTYYYVTNNDPALLPRNNYDITIGNPMRGLCPSPDNISFKDWTPNLPASVGDFKWALDSFMLNDPDDVGEDNAFNWAFVESKFQEIANHSVHAIIRFYVHWPGKEFNVPAYLYKSPYNFSPIHGNTSIYYDDPALKNAFRQCITALANKYDGDPRLLSIQAGFAGYWGEWHTSGCQINATTSCLPPSVNNEIIQWYKAAFRKTHIQVRYPEYTNAYDAGYGYFDDSFTFYTLNGTYNGGVDREAAWFFWNNAILYGVSDFWKTSLMGGEVRPENDNVFADSYLPGTEHHQEFNACAEITHATVIGYSRGWHANGYTGVNGTELIRAQYAHSRMGYSFEIDTVAVAATPSIQNAIDMDVTLMQTGVAPFYYPLSLSLYCVFSGTITKIGTKPISNLTLVERYSTTIISFQSISVSPACLSGIEFKLESPYLYPGRPIKWAQGFTGRIILRIPPLPPTPPVTVTPTKTPTKPTSTPTKTPTTPTNTPTKAPTTKPTQRPVTASPLMTRTPTTTPLKPSTRNPTASPLTPTTQKPTTAPSRKPTRIPTSKPSMRPKKRKPTATPVRTSTTRKPTVKPSRKPTSIPTTIPVRQVTRKPTAKPSRKPTRIPTGTPVRQATRQPTGKPSRKPTRIPTATPMRQPTRKPTGKPSRKPTRIPTATPMRQPTRKPTGKPSRKPTRIPTATPMRQPTRKPTGKPSRKPTRIPTATPMRQPTRKPTGKPSRKPTRIPTATPVRTPTRAPTKVPLRAPTRKPTVAPRAPTNAPVTSPNWVTNWYFVNVTSNTVLYNVGKIVNGQSYTYASLGKFLSLVFETNSLIDKVNFTWPVTNYTVENSPPYALQGNSGTKYVRATYLINPGFKTIRVQTYLKSNALAFTQQLNFTMI